MYGEAILKRRCLVVCSGFFEWRQYKSKKYPYYITLKDDEVFVFGGVYNSFVDEETGEMSGSYAVITIPANEMMEKIHNTKKRMPLIIEAHKAKKWLDNDLSEKEIKSFFEPIESLKLKAHTIKKFIPSKTEESNTPELLAYYHYPELSALIKEQGNLFEDI